MARARTRAYVGMGGSKPFETKGSHHPLLLVPHESGPHYEEVTAGRVQSGLLHR